MISRRIALASLAVVTAGAAAVGACGHGAADAPIANHGRSAGSGVRAIDWRNRAYELDEVGAIDVVDGRAEFAIDDEGHLSPSGGTPGLFRVEPPLFGDIDGDGSEDAVVSSVLGTGGTGQFSSVTIYTLRGGKVIALGEIPGGDRGDGGIRRIGIDGSAVLIDRNVLAEGDGACCASTWRRERWVWRDGAMAEDIAARGPAQPVP